MTSSIQYPASVCSRRRVSWTQVVSQQKAPCGFTCRHHLPSSYASTHKPLFTSWANKGLNSTPVSAPVYSSLCVRFLFTPALHAASCLHLLCVRLMFTPALCATSRLLLFCVWPPVYSCFVYGIYLLQFWMRLPFWSWYACGLLVFLFSLLTPVCYRYMVCCGAIAKKNFN